MTRWLAGFWRWLWKDWDVRGPASIGKAQLEKAIARKESETRHLELMTSAQQKRNWKRGNWKRKLHKRLTKRRDASTVDSERSRDKNRSGAGE